MTGRTHDLAAFTALNTLIATQPLPDFSFATGVVALGACFIGGLTPDIDTPTSDFWHKFPAGSVFGRLLHPFLGAHRLISHSILGFIIFGLLTKQLLTLASSILLVDMNIAWFTFMLGYLSHLIIDSLTTEGVPWLFPIPIRLGFPPFKFLRPKTGGIFEKVIFFPGLLIFNGYLIYSFYPIYLGFLHRL